MADHGGPEKSDEDDEQQPLLTQLVNMIKFVTRNR